MTAQQAWNRNFRWGVSLLEPSDDLPALWRARRVLAAQEQIRAALTVAGRSGWDAEVSMANCEGMTGLWLGLHEGYITNPSALLAVLDIVAGVVDGPDAMLELTLELAAAGTNPALTGG